MGTTLDGKTEDEVDYGKLYQTKKNVYVVKKDGSKEAFNVQKVISADEAGELKVELEVSNSGGANNWPQAIYMGERISAALYKHGVTNRKVEITLIPSTEYNERYNLYQ